MTAEENNETTKAVDDGPMLRHEFVGMMFAVTAAEVGLQVAAIVQRGNPIHYLPAYSHLFLATIIVGASWVGWSLSPSPGARQDVAHVLSSGFIVLLTDVLLVIIYFILVRSVDFGAERTPPYIATIPHVAFWVAVMFGVYFIWDVIAKFPFLYNRKFDKDWVQQDGTRILATAICFFLALFAKHEIGDPDRLHYIPADFALLSLILLFRALKDWCSAFFPTRTVPPKDIRPRKRWAVLWTVTCAVFMLVGIVWTKCAHPLPNEMARQIKSALAEEQPKDEAHSAPAQLNPEK